MNWLPTSLPSLSAVAAAGAGLAGVGLCLVACTWHFHRDGIMDEKASSRGTKETQQFVMKTCGGGKFANSIATSGFVLSSLRHLAKDVASLISGAHWRVAREGRAWPDAPVAELDPAGGPLASPPRVRRLHDFAPAPGRPIVLNFGSMT